MSQLDLFEVAEQVTMLEALTATKPDFKTHAEHDFIVIFNIFILATEFL